MGQAQSHYDVVFHINDVSDVYCQKGWPVEFSEAQQGLKPQPKWNGTCVGVLGRFKQGKTFLLSKLAGLKFITEGETINTEGLSIKFQHNPQSPFVNVILDAAGLNMPVNRMLLFTLLTVNNSYGSKS